VPCFSPKKHVLPADTPAATPESPATDPESAKTDFVRYRRGFNRRPSGTPTNAHIRSPNGAS